MEEPDIIINGSRLTVAQSAVVRIALGSFALSLRAHDLGKDEHGLAMTKLYNERMEEIIELL